MQNDLQALWQDIMDRAVPNLPERSAELWFPTCSPVAVEDDELVIDVANVFTKEQIANRFLDELNKAAKSTGKVSSIRLYVGEEIDVAWEKRAKKTVAPSKNNKNELNLNPNYDFSSFVVGRSNRLAHAASLAVAETPGEAYNPLFIWGGVGLGKTHLMHAICHYTLSKRNDLNVVYVSCEKFVNEFVDSMIQRSQGNEFKNKYRNVDILLIDDIQFIGGKNSSQEEFFHTFDSLRIANKQIVICSDRPPIELNNVEDRLVSRFAWGLVTDIQPPDLETRIAILQKKARMKAHDMPDDVVDFLAQRIPSNIRELEGALNRVMACSELSSEPITIDNTSMWLKDVLRNDMKSPTTIGSIQSLVAESFEMSVDDLLSSKRTAEIALARQVAMYLCREKTESSLQNIGQAFRKKDHTTVLHAHKKISQIIKGDNGIRDIVEKIKNKL